MKNDAVTPITEQANELTLDLDLSEPLGIARLLRQSDAQLFAGYRAYPGIMDPEMIEKCARLAVTAARAIKAGPKGAILMSGAGTSGRFAQLLSRQFNRLLRQAHLAEVFVPLVAGGHMALVKAQEGAEDDPHQGIRDLNAGLPEDATEVLYFGITCGLSAPYVAGQLHHLADRPGATSVLMGFSPGEAARNVAVEGWDRTFLQVLKAVEENENFVLLNPVYGPEGLMGSTRMKGGSATKILLETIFYAALEIAGVLNPETGAKAPDAANPESVERRVRQLLRRYREVIGVTYEHMDTLTELIRLGGATLRSGGKITYLGRDTAGILGLIDASECPPTFGANFEDIRGFLRNGWKELLDEDRDYSSSGPQYQIDLDTFEKTKLPDLSKGDLVLGIAVGELGPNTRMLLEHARKTKATTAMLLVTAVAPNKSDLPVDPDNCHIVTVPSLGFAPGFQNLAELALKLALNALSTGAHVLIGKVYHNRMIDLRISNNKLYFRALRTIERIAHVREEEAKVALHRAVFRKDKLTAEELAAPPSAIIAAGTTAPRIVPIALLLAQGRMAYAEAAEQLAEDPVARRVIKKELEKSGVLKAEQ